jgi:hypothetical protein
LKRHTNSMTASVKNRKAHSFLWDTSFRIVAA